MDHRFEQVWVPFAAGLLLGVALGAAVALLTAPEPGKRVRGRLRKTARRLGEGAAKGWEGLAEGVRERWRGVGKGVEP